MLIAFFVQNENTDFKLDFGFQSWECRCQEVSLTCGRRLHRICVPAPVLQRRCPARPHLCGVVARYPNSDGSCNFQGVGIKNCRPVVRLQILSENKENRPAGDQRILSEVYGGKMVRCDCGAAVYHSKVVDMG